MHDKLTPTGTHTAPVVVVDTSPSDASIAVCMRVCWLLDSMLASLCVLASLCFGITVGITVCVCVSVDVCVSVGVYVSVGYWIV